MNQRFFILCLLTFTLVLCPESQAGKRKKSSEKKTASAAEARGVEEGFVTPPRGLKSLPTLGEGGAIVFGYHYESLMGFDHGDLIYGTQEHRADSMRVLKLLELSGGSYGAKTADVFNNLILYKLGGASPLDLQINEFVITGQLEELDRVRFGKYTDHLLNAAGLTLEMLPGLQEMDGEFFKQACELAILFNHRTGKKIHFILDHLDVIQAITPGTENFDSYTSYELRSAFLYWTKDPTLLNTVRFYANGRRLDNPPWLAEDGRILPGWGSLAH